MIDYDKLKPLAPGQCHAIVETTEGAKQYTMQRIRTTRPKRCERAAKKKIGPLCLCSTHVRMTRDGFVYQSGEVASKGSIADARRYKDKFPGGLTTWHREFETEDLPDVR